MILTIVSFNAMEKMIDVLSKNIDIKVDRNLLKDFRRYVMGIFTRDSDHVQFLSGNLIGIHTPYFFKTDENYFWDSIMEVDRIHLSQVFHYPHTRVHKEWNISGDLMNNCLAWLIHLILNSKLSDKEKESFTKEILILFQYKFLTSKIRRDYGYGANHAVANAAHDSLGGHFLIKHVDSWKEYFSLRADRMWDGDGVGKHKDMVGILKSYKDEKDVTNAIAGIANNMNTMMKAYNAIFHAIHGSGGGISLSSPISLDSEGVETVVDSTAGFGKYLRILDSRVAIRNEFINNQLIELIVSETTARESKVKALLDHVSKTYGDRKHRETELYVTNGVIFAFTELSNDEVVVDDIRSVVKVLLGKMGARRSDNEVFDLFEKNSAKVLKASIGNNKHGISAKNVAIVYMVVLTLLTGKGD